MLFRRPNGHTARTICLEVATLLIWGAAVGCLGGSEDGQGDRGLARTASVDGTKIKFDPLAEPMPEIPFPNDIATVIDPTSPTGRRVNIRMRAPTSLEHNIRVNMNQLDGFGTFAPITVSFERPLDLRTVNERTVYVLDIDPASPRFGQRIPLDFPPYETPALTNFPVFIEGIPYSDQHPREEYDFGYFHFDYRWMVDNLLFEGVEEDTDCNGVLDPNEDTDFDGTLDHPNVPYPECYNPACFVNGSPHPDICPQPQAWDVKTMDSRLVTTFEHETNTLILKPLIPLEQRRRYAVVLTYGIKDQEGNPIRSPFGVINHSTQTESLQVLDDILPRYGLALSDVAFTWCFTTQSITQGLEVIRAGLNGSGPLAYLAERFPPDLETVMDHRVSGLGENGNTSIIKPENLKELFSIVLTAMTFSWIDMGDLIPMIQTLLEDTERYVDYFVVGTFKTPMFLDTPESHFDIDYRTGRARVGEDSVPFWLCVPKKRGPDHPVPSWYPDPPFPVAFYGHGYSGSKMEALGFACHLARFGLATFAMDETGHGPPAELSNLAGSLDRIAQDEQGNEMSVDEILMGLGPFRDVILKVLSKLVVRYDPDSTGSEDLYRECMAYADPATPKCATQGACPAKCMVLRFSETPLFKGAFLSGRAKLVNDEGVLVSGMDFWTAQSFHTRDIVRQAVVDYFQAVRVLKAFDGRRRWSFDLDKDGTPELAGDFNGDGVVDVGGPCVAGRADCDPDDPDDPTRQNYSAMGQSMGGFIVSILQAVEPGITSIAPISGGGGVFDVGMRTSNEGVREAVYLELLGPMIIGGAKKDLCRRWTYYDVCDESEFTSGDGWYLAYDRLDGTLEKIEVIAPLPALNKGDVVHVRNLSNGEEDSAGVVSLGYDLEGHEMLGFRVTIPADVGDRLLVQVFDGSTNRVVWEREIASKARGYGHKRNSPDLRRLLGLAQMILDPADPVNYAPHYFWDPLAAGKPKSALIIHTLGDMKVPVNTGLTLARAARILDYEHPVDLYDNRTENDMLVTHWLAEAIPRMHRFEGIGKGDYFDPDNLAEGQDDDCRFGTYPGGRCQEFVFNSPHLEDFYPKAGATYETRFLRKTIPTPGAGSRNYPRGEHSGLRIPNIMVYDNAMKSEDRHGIFLSAPTKAFNLDQYMIYLIGRYFQSRSAELLGERASDNAACLENRKDLSGRPVNACDFWEGTP